MPDSTKPKMPRLTLSMFNDDTVRYHFNIRDASFLQITAVIEDIGLNKLCNINLQEVPNSMIGSVSILNLATNLAMDSELIYNLFKSQVHFQSTHTVISSKWEPWVAFICYINHIRVPLGRVKLVCSS